MAYHWQQILANKFTVNNKTNINKANTNKTNIEKLIAKNFRNSFLYIFSLYKKADTKKEAAPETPVATVKPAKEAVQTDSTETAEMVDPATVWGEVKDEIKE